MEEVVWKDVKGYEGVYRVNSDGQVWRCRMVGCDKYELIKEIGG